MPQVPDLVPSVAPTTSGVAGPSLAVPVEAFGGAVGHALQGFGVDIEKSSDRIWEQAVQLKGLQNETAAKNADADYMVAAGKADAEFMSREGENASPEALSAHIDNLRTMRGQFRDKLGNLQAQTMYDGSSLSNMGSMIRLAAGHAARQARVAANGASTARVDQASDFIGEHPTDELSYQRGVRTIASETEAQGRNSGWSADQIKETSAQNVSTATAKRVVGLAKTDAIGAQSLADAAAKTGALLPADALRVQATVQTNFRQQGSRIISDQVLAGRKEGDEDEKTEEQYLADGMTRADAIMKKTGIQDDLFKDYVRQRIMTDYGLQKRVERDSDNQNLVTVGKAMLKANAEGSPPTNIEQLKALDPNVSPALDALSRNPAKIASINEQLRRNATGEYRIPTTPENLQITHGFVGMANSPDNEARVAFLGKDFASEAKLTVQQKERLMSLQDGMKKQSQADPRVARALAILGPDLNSAGISHTGGDKEGYYQFVGGLQDALEQFDSGKTGKVPTPEEIRTMGSRLMQEQLTGRRGWFVFTKETTPLYQMPVSDEDAERIRGLDIWQKKGIANPTDSMIQRFYHAEKYKELYGKSAAGASATQ